MTIIKTPYDDMHGVSLKRQSISSKNPEAERAYWAGAQLGYRRGVVDTEARYKALVSALSDMIEHFATVPDERTAISYHKTHKQVVAEAKSVLAQAQDKKETPDA